MKYLSTMLPVIAVLLALGGAIYYVLCDEPKVAAPTAAQNQTAATPPNGLVPPGYANKPS